MTTDLGEIVRAGIAALGELPEDTLLMKGLEVSKLDLYALGKTPKDSSTKYIGQVNIQNDRLNVVSDHAHYNMVLEKLSDVLRDGGYFQDVHFEYCFG